MNFPPFRMPENLLENFDTDLQIFYHKILSKEVDLSSSAKTTAIRQALKNVVHAYKKETVDSNSSKIQFDSSEKRCAYVLKHCPCFTSAVAKHFLQLLQRNSGVLDQALYRRQINICCLGGGPGTEAVAIAKVIDLLKNSVLLRNRCKIHLSVTEVDLSKEWKPTAELVLRTFQRSPTFCDSERIRISFKIIKADLTEPFEDDVRKALREADIITMVYFVSAVNGSKAQNRCVPMLQNIVELAKPGAVLFFLDSAKKLHFNSMMDSVKKFQNLKLIYGPIVQEFHTISIKSIKKFIELYFNQFSAFLCLTNCFITCVSWSKEDCSITNLRCKGYGVGDGLTSSDTNFIIKENRKWYKMKENNTRKQERFRKRVEKLILSEMKINFEEVDWEESDYKPDMELQFYHKKIFNAGKAKQKRIVFPLE